MTCDCGRDRWSWWGCAQVRSDDDDRKCQKKGYLDGFSHVIFHFPFDPPFPKVFTVQVLTFPRKVLSRQVHGYMMQIGCYFKSYSLEQNGNSGKEVSHKKAKKHIYQQILHSLIDCYSITTSQRDIRVKSFRLVLLYKEFQKNTQTPMYPRKGPDGVLSPWLCQSRISY